MQPSTLGPSVSDFLLCLRPRDAFFQRLRGHFSLCSVCQARVCDCLYCLLLSQAHPYRSSLIATSRYFGKTREPFALTIAGQKMYFIMSPKDMAAVYKNTTTLTFDGFIRDLYTTFGMSKDGIRLMWQTRSTDSLDTSTPNVKQYHLGEGVHREQLHPGPQLEDITAKYLEQIQQQLVWSHIPASTYSLKGKESKMVMLYDWCADVLGHAAMNALYGDGLLQLEPRLLEYFYTFDQESWKLTFQLPPLFARDMHTAKDNARQAYIRYFQLPQEKRSQACHYLRTVEAKQRQAGMSDNDIGIAAQMFFWGSVLPSDCSTFYFSDRSH